MVADVKKDEDKNIDRFGLPEVYKVKISERKRLKFITVMLFILLLGF